MNKMIKNDGVSVVAIASLICLCGISHAADPLMPEDIIALCGVGQSDIEVISVLQSRGINFDVNLSVIQKFVESGVSPGIIQVVMGLSNPEKKASTRRTFTGKTQASLALYSDPDALNVFIDGVGMGVTPLLSNKLKPGKHMIRVEHPLFFTREEMIDFTGEESIVLDWAMEPREPVIRINVKLEAKNDDYAWTWIIRPRSRCPDDVTLNLKPWRFGAAENEALFVLDDDSKKLYKSFGKCCLEVFLWRGEMRKDIPIRDLPPCTARYLISNIEFMGIQSVQMTLKIKVDKMDPTNPELILDSDTGILVDTGDRVPGRTQHGKRDLLLDDLDQLFSEK